MARIYTLLECGCLISCDGGGGLIPVCRDDDPNCKVQEYLDKHSDWCDGYCRICHPYDYSKAQAKMTKSYKNIIEDVRNHEKSKEN